MLEDLDVISGRLREAIYDPSAWSTVLDSINAFLGASGVTLLCADERLKHAPCSSDLVDLMDDYFSNGWYANDHRNACLPRLRSVGVVFDHEVFDPNKIDSGYNDYYTKFINKHGLKWFAGLATNLQDDLWCLALQRSPKKGPFTTADLPRLGAVRTLVEKAAVRARLVGNHWIEGALAAFESDGAAAFIVDRLGTIIRMNDAARSILGSPFMAYETKVTSNTRPPQTFGQVLRSMVLEAAVVPGVTRDASIRIGSTSYLLDATSIVGNKSLIFSRASVLVRLRPHLSDPGERLKHDYGLTSAESRVAIALAAGHDVKAMAEMFAVKPNTIRAQLKTTYAKTDTRSQATLSGFVTRLDRVR